MGSFDICPECVRWGGSCREHSQTVSISAPNIIYVQFDGICPNCGNRYPSVLNWLYCPFCGEQLTCHLIAEIANGGTTGSNH